MTNEQRNKVRPPADGYYTSTSRKTADFLIGFVWMPVFYFSIILVLSNLFFTPDTYWYSIGCLCLLIFQWIFFYRRGRNFIVKGGIISVILCWLVLWAGMQILFREPRPIPFDRPVWLTAATSSRTRHTMLTDLLLRGRRGR